MSCILCFIEDDYQEKIRSLSRSKSERFENIITDFQKNFLNELKFLDKIDDCEIHKNLNVKTKKFASKFKDEIDNLNDLNDFCNEIRNIYLHWIKGNTISASKSLESLLNSKKILNSTENVDKSIFFRGRISNEILNAEDLFHIPFNKRHLIINQRYSISGQPLLYFGLSPIDIVYELRQNIDNIKNIYFCSFVHASEEKLNILNLTNPFTDFFSNCEIIFGDFDSEGLEYKIGMANDFYKFILIQYCSFKRSRWTECGVFAEEYVLSQLLSQVVRECGFKGILFSSTRVDTKVCYSKAKFRVNRHRENLALFTEYNESDNIDRNLFKQFIPSKPIKIDDKIDLALDDLSVLRRQAIKLYKLPNAVIPFPFNIAEITGITTEVRFKDLVINNNGFEQPYFEHDIGKLHLQLIYQMVLELRNRL